MSLLSSSALWAESSLGGGGPVWGGGFVGALGLASVYPPRWEKNWSQWRSGDYLEIHQSAWEEMEPLQALGGNAKPLEMLTAAV